MGLVTAVAGACEPEPAPVVWERGLEVGEEVGSFLSAWGPGAQEIYAVGGNPEAGALFRFDGAAWAAEPLPPGFPLANWIYGFPDPEGSGETVLWVAGNGGRIARRGGDGVWSEMALERERALWGIWGAADDDLWVVGGDLPGDGPVLAHWDGAAWTEVTPPAVDRPFEALFKIWGTGPADLFAVGHRGVILHYDGETWEQQLAGTSADLISLWGPGGGSRELVAVGGRSNGVIARYDGETWSSETIGMLPGLNGVWIAGDGGGLVVGNDGVVLTLAAGGFDWTLVDRSTAPLTLHGAFGVDGGPRFGVGGNLLFSPPWIGVIVQSLP